MDPYRILGISSDATDEEVKKAYRSLSKKYHPDANLNNPNKDVYTEKFKEVQNAYEQIMQMRKSGFQGGFDSFYQNNNTYGGTQTKNQSMYQSIISYLNSGQYQMANQLLEQIQNKDSYWFYLSAIAQHGLGNLVRAQEFATVAVQMDPGNINYQLLLRQLQSGRSNYQNKQGTYGRSMSGVQYCCQIILCSMFCRCC